MDNNTCHLIKDLLPLYVDDAVSQESMESIRAHLVHCESCHREYDILKKELAIPTSPRSQEAERWVLKRFKRMWQYQKVTLCCFSVLLTLALVGFGLLALFHYVGESAIFKPRMDATLWNFDTGEQWQTVTFDNGEKCIIFDNPFYQKELVLGVDSSADLEFRILDSNGEVVLEPQILTAGRAVDLHFLADDTPYILEIRVGPEARGKSATVEGHYFALVCR